MSATGNIYTNNLRIFSGTAHPHLAKQVAHHLNVPLGNLMVARFNDGEIRVRVEESARGNDVFIIQPTCSPVNENLMELLIMLDAFRRASAQRITVVLPYYGYARQDKKIEGREPVTARLVADLITEAGANRLLCVDLHARQIQGFFRIPMDHLPAGPIIGRYLRSEGLVGADTCVVSPDEGGVVRARALAVSLGAPLAIIAKKRPEPGKVEVVEIIGDVAGKRCILIDDMIDTGGSMVGGAHGLIARGASSIYACCTHAVLSKKAVGRISESPIERLIVTDTIPYPCEQKYIDSGFVHVLSVAPMLADAIQRIHSDDSVSDLIDNSW